MKLSAVELTKILAQAPYPSHYLVAFSGGLDSTVLLHALTQAKLNIPIQAVYIEHGLQAISKDWIQHCQNICQQWQISFSVQQLDLVPHKGDSIEALARKARYAALESQLKPNGVLLTAQHADDQIETFLLQFLRGSGVAGLASMPFCKTWGKGWHVRPLLSFTRKALAEYAQQYELHWIEDPSNQNLDFDRNYLRKKVIPILKQRWQGLAKTTLRSAHFCAESNTLNQVLAKQSCDEIQQGNRLNHYKLKALPEIQQRNILRFWITTSGFELPNHSRLQQIQQFIGQKNKASAQVAWQQTELRVYQDYFFLMRPLCPFDPSIRLNWNTQLTPKYPLPAHLGTLEINSNRACNLQIRFRQGGERFKAINQAHSKDLKHIFQENKVLPWMRQRIPLIYQQNQLIQIGNLKYHHKGLIKWHTDLALSTFSG